MGGTPVMDNGIVRIQAVSWGFTPLGHFARTM